MLLALVFAVLSVVVLAGWLVRRREIRDTVEGRRPVVSDEHLREILSRGAVSYEEEEPLDEDEIRAEEDRFWAEGEWDEPDEFRP